MDALVIVGLVESCFGHADVLVTADGTLVPASEVRRLYAPIDGELTNIYIAEAQPINKAELWPGCTRAARSRPPRTLSRCA